MSTYTNKLFVMEDISHPNLKLSNLKHLSIERKVVVVYSIGTLNCCTMDLETTELPLMVSANANMK